jgi:hypothetical protein
MIAGAKGWVGISWILQAVLMIYLWSAAERQSLFVLGYASLASVALGGVVLAIATYITAKKGGLSISMKVSTVTARMRSNRTAIVHGLQAMILDVSVQLAITIGVYMSAYEGLADLYQMSSMQAAMPSYGTAYSIACAYFMKLAGSMLIGRKDYDRFQMLTYLALGTSAALVVVVFATVLPYKNALAFYYGENACVFASEEACMPVYVGMFGSTAGTPDTLQRSMDVFTVAAAAKCVYIVVKAGLYACFDFKFLAICGILSLVVLFAPAICIAHFAFGTPAAIYAAMYSPTIVLTCVFTARLFWNTVQMRKGEEGPWSYDSNASSSECESDQSGSGDSSAGDA